jgi:hypothetical protein
VNSWRRGSHSRFNAGRCRPAAPSQTCNHILLMTLYASGVRNAELTWWERAASARYADPTTQGGRSKDRRTQNFPSSSQNSTLPTCRSLPQPAPLLDRRATAWKRILDPPRTTLDRVHRRMCRKRHGRFCVLGRRGDVNLIERKSLEDSFRLATIRPGLAGRTLLRRFGRDTAIGAH